MKIEKYRGSLFDLCWSNFVKTLQYKAEENGFKITNVLKRAWADFFFFFLTKVQSKHICPLSYNVFGLGVVPPCTNFDFSTKLSGGITPNPCYRIVLFFVGWLKQI